MPQESKTRIDIPGFTKEATELVRDIEEYGWTFRPSNHGVVGRAPDGTATISVGRKSSKSNRGYQNSYATFKRWLRLQHPEAAEAADAYQEETREAEKLAETEPIIGEILSRRALVRAADKILQIEEHNEGSTPAMSKESIIETHPWHPKNTSLHDGVTRVIERVWANGGARRRTDYACAMADCPYTSSSVRSVSQHYGSAHTLRGPSPVVEVEPEVVEVDEPAVITWQPTTATTTTSTAYAAAVEARSDHDIIAAIRQMVSQPLLDQITDLLSDVANREDENKRLTQERDTAVEQLAKIQSDLDALRQLIASIGLPAPA